MVPVKNCNRCGIVYEVRITQTKNSGKWYTYLRCRYCVRVSKKSSKYSIPHEDVIKYNNTKKCKICNKELVQSDINIDHCHKSLKVRGVLCSNCNKGLGFFKDNIIVLKKAIKYLKNNE